MEPAELVFLNTEIVLLLLRLVTTRSGFPSQSMSPITTLYGFTPVAKSTFVANELMPRDPDELVFRSTEMLLLLVFVTTISGFPSPSMSPIAMPSGLVPVVKSIFVENELVVMEPVELVFLNTEMVLPRLFVTTRSGFPSPSRSPIATPNGFVVPVVKSTFVPNEAIATYPAPPKVGINGALEEPVNPVVVSVTAIGAYVAPAGTFTVSPVDVPEVTAAFTAPKYGTFFVEFALKFVPLMKTLVPTDPDVGVKEVIVGI